MNTGETEKHHKKYDFNDVTFAFYDVQSRIEKMQRMWGNILLLKKLKYTRENNMYRISTMNC